MFCSRDETRSKFVHLYKCSVASNCCNVGANNCCDVGANNCCNVVAERCRRCNIVNADHGNVLNLGFEWASVIKRAV